MIPWQHYKSPPDMLRAAVVRYKITFGHFVPWITLASVLVMPMSFSTKSRASDSARKSGQQYKPKPFSDWYVIDTLYSPPVFNHDTRPYRSSWPFS